MNKVYDKAESVMDMHATLEDPLRTGIIKASVDSRYEKWNKTWDEIPKERPLSKIFPIKLGKRPSNEEPVDDYEYLPLDRVASEIRVIVIASSSDPNAPRSCTRHIVR